MKRLALLTWLVLGVPAALGQVSFKVAPKGGELQIAIAEQPIANYAHLGDVKISRPFFHKVRLPGGPQLTRNHPPIAGKDATDHDTMHPGIWLAFGDVNGHDTWRNKAYVRHDRFIEEPKAVGAGGAFAVRNWWVLDKREKIFAEEETRFKIEPQGNGFLLTWDTTITPHGDRLVFGDQEEMGLGIRVATPLTVKNGGRILNSDGHTNEKQVWGKTAAWCEYSGVIDGRRVGFRLTPHPDNFRPSWFHARDYGLLVANAFGRNAFTKGEKSRVEIRHGETLRLRYSLLAFQTSSQEAKGQK